MVDPDVVVVSSFTSTYGNPICMVQVIMISLTAISGVACIFHEGHLCYIAWGRG